MSDLDGVSEGALPAPMDHDSVGRGHDLGSGIGRVVHTAVGAPPLQHGVEAAVLEAPGDAAIGERLQKEGPPYGLTVEVVVRATAVPVRIEEHRVVRSAGVHELRGEQLARAHRSVGAHLALEGEAIGVADADLPREVDLPLKHSVEMVDQLVAVREGEIGERLVVHDRVPEDRLDLSHSRRACRRRSGSRSGRSASRTRRGPGEPSRRG